MANLISILAGGLTHLVAAAEEGLLEDTSDLLSGLSSFSFWPEWGDFWIMLLRLIVNTVTISVIVHGCYYPKVKRRDYYFTFTLIGLSIFLLIYLMGGVKLQIGFALGLFAIFGILKYRTESVPIREMTYLFIIIAVAAINGLATKISFFELLFVNAVFVIALFICENVHWMKHISTKLINYDNPKLAIPEKEEELKADLMARTGLDIIRIEVGNIDFLKDSVMIKIYYNPVMDEFGTIDNVNKCGKKM